MNLTASVCRRRGIALVVFGLSFNALFSLSVSAADCTNSERLEVTRKLMFADAAGLSSAEYAAWKAAYVARLTQLEQNSGATSADLYRVQIASHADVRRRLAAMRSEERIDRWGLFAGDEARQALARERIALENAEMKAIANGGARPPTTQ